MVIIYKNKQYSEEEFRVAFGYSHENLQASMDALLAAGAIEVFDNTNTMPKEDSTEVPASNEIDIKLRFESKNDAEKFAKHVNKKFDPDFIGIEMDLNEYTGQLDVDLIIHDLEPELADAIVGDYKTRTALGNVMTKAGANAEYIIGGIIDTTVNVIALPVGKTALKIGSSVTKSAAKLVTKTGAAVFNATCDTVRNTTNELSGDRDVKEAGMNVKAIAAFLFKPRAKVKKR